MATKSSQTPTPSGPVDETIARRASARRRNRPLELHTPKGVILAMVNGLLVEAKRLRWAIPTALPRTCGKRDYAATSYFVMGGFSKMVSRVIVPDLAGRRSNALEVAPVALHSLCSALSGFKRFSTILWHFETMQMQHNRLFQSLTWPWFFVLQRNTRTHFWQALRSNTLEGDGIGSGYNLSSMQLDSEEQGA